MFTIGYSISPAMVMNMVGAGSKYPFAYRDADGDYLSGGSSYRLHIPANVPAANFWSVTLYDASNASGLDNGQPYPSIGSLSPIEYNEDGSVDLYFGPELPAGAPETNWLRTVPGKTEAVLRLGAMYGFEFAERYAITPSIALDLVGRANAVVYGVNLGVVF